MNTLTVYLAILDVLTMTDNENYVSTLKKRKLDMAITQTQGLIETCTESDELRLKENSFTRDRSLGAERLLQMLLYRIYHSLQLFLDSFFSGIGKNPVSKQAFSNARKHLNPEYVRSFFDMTSKLAADDQAMPSYKGMRLIAIDGSTIALENTPELRRGFGCSGPRKNVATATCSIAYGPMDHVVYDCCIDRYGTDERDLAKEHVRRLAELGLKGSILLHDRFYPSAEYIAFLVESGFHFVMRLRKNFSMAADSYKSQGWINPEHNGKSYPVRVLKVKLDTGETETLITSLHQLQLPVRKAGALYFERWKVETAYDRIKSKLELENLSGKTETSVLQDFYATMYLANMCAFAAEEADAQIAEADKQKELKHTRKSNQNRTISKLREVFLRVITERDEAKRTALLDKMVEDIARYPVQVVPGRSPKRKLPREKRFYQTKRSVLE
jgi:hypothetical protein